ncbi:MAG TPA: hypothetical protein VFB80_17715, partial [Pirellulaceae bacterium]|nr:hypothetical protein [Pirellulaceae bacterium]
MPIEFHCSQCNQLLRVPDASAGKNARCPKCQTLMTVPAPALPNSFAPPGSFASPSATPLAPAFSSSPPAKPAGAAPGNPFAGDALAKPGGNPFAGSINPYAAPAGGYEYQSFAAPDAPIVNVQVPFEPIWNHAWSVWQANLGILVGVTAIIVGISYAIVIPMAVVRFVLEQNNNRELGAVVGVLAQIANNLIQIYLGIGQAQISLKLARGQPAEVKDLFAGGSRFLPVLGAVL